MSQEEQAKQLQQIKGCKICTSWRHDHSTCDAKTKTCGAKDGNQTCNQPHNKMFHGFKHAYINHQLQVSTCDHSEAIPIMLPMQEFVIQGKTKTTIFYDGGSNVSLITHDLAEILKLPGKPITTTIRYATMEPKVIHTKLYTITITLNDGSKRKMMLMGVEQITSDPVPYDVEAAYALFPHISPGSLQRPSIPVGVLIGYDQY